MVAPFSEDRFPIDLAFGSMGGPERRTEIVTLGSGKEERNQRWRRSRRRYDAGYGVKTLDELHAVTAFFEARRGPLQAFRFKDAADWKSCPPGQVISATDQRIAVGDGVETVFAIYKQYGESADAYQRRIDKPVKDTVVVAVDGVEDTNVSVNALDGEVRFETPPADGADITAGFEFDVPVRFDTDHLATSLAAFDAGELPSIPLLEVLL
jgi:uncharacterized protein (TIGR02217 family)